MALSNDFIPCESLEYFACKQQLTKNSLKDRKGDVRQWFSAISRHLSDMLDSFINLECCSRSFYELATFNLDITSVVGL